MKLSYSEKGSNLIQTSTLIALVAVTCIIAITTLGNSVLGGFNFFNQHLEKKPSNIQSNQQMSLNNKNNNAMQPGSLNRNALNFTITNVATLVETSGANGSLNSLLANLKLQAKYFKSTDQITEAQYLDLMSLVLQGYRMAEAEKVVEIAIANSNNSSETLANMQVTFEGKVYSVEALRQEFGVAPNYRQPGTIFENFLAAKNALTSQMTNIQAKEIITILADQILTVSNSFEGAIGYSTLGYDTTTDTIAKHTASVNSLNELSRLGIVNTSWDTPLPEPPSTFTKKNSDAICQQGKGQKNRVNCNKR